MLKILRARFDQGHRTNRFPQELPPLPDRFRGRPRFDASRCPEGCRACVEACPTDAITHGHGFELASYDVATLVQRKEMMLEAARPGAQPPVIAAPAPGGHH